MKIETLKSRKRKYFLYVLVVGVVLLLPLVLSITFGKYQTTQSIKIVEGTIRNYSPADLNILAIKVQNDSGEYESSDTIPESGYGLNETESYCTIPDGSGGVTIDTSIPMEYKDGKVYIGVNTKGTKCYLYFDIKIITIQNILATKTITTRTDFNTVFAVNTTGTIYAAEDDYGTSYYFAGIPSDNWVKFAGFYWRIIRINGDGTIRMIYQGESANTTGTGTQITTRAFNSGYKDNMYVGYMYTSGQVHGTGTTSTIKEALDTWYNNYLASYANNIATGNGATFCNDRQPSSSASSLDGYVTTGKGTVKTYYAGYIRLYTNRAPTFKCADSGDRFSTSIGLITADEVAYAGGVWYTNITSYYLYTGQYYWTMSPISYNSSVYAGVFLVGSDGQLASSVVNNAWGVRPVINLKSDTAFADGGTGTAENPYVVS